jgi:hypothetical protein
MPVSGDAPIAGAADSRDVKRTLVLLAALVLGTAPTASADISVGIADDRGKYAEDGGAWFYNTMRGAGLTENRIVVLWDSSRPTMIPEKGFLDRSLPQAAGRGVRIVFAVYPVNPGAMSEDPQTTASFTAFLQLLARTYPQVKHFVVGNEPNLSRFWRPQFDGAGNQKSGAAFMALLTASYDALKAVDPGIRVIAAGLSERGNDNPNAPSNVSTSPVRFVAAMGAAYRASGRTTPIMDEFDYHPYPESNSDPLLRAYAWPSVGYGNTERLKQALWDAFNGTGQPTIGSGLTLRVGEIGWQVAASGPAYTGVETVPVTDEARQAAIYAEFLAHAACDPDITSVNFFGLLDEHPLDRWQAALLRADGSRRPSYDAVASWMAQTGGRCPGAPRAWRPATKVIGAGVEWGDLSRPRWWKQTSWSFKVTAAEEATYRAGIFRLPEAGKKRSEAVAAIPRLLATTAPATAVLSAVGTVPAHWKPQVKFAARRLPPGSYVYAVSLAAAMNPARVSAFVSTPFRVK